MQWEDCPKCNKCPSFLINKQVFDSGVLFVGNNFEICLPCINGRKNNNKFFIWGTATQFCGFLTQRQTLRIYLNVYSSYLIEQIYN